MHEYDYTVPPQALWEWDDGQSMYPPNTDAPMIIYRGADSKYTPALEGIHLSGAAAVLTIRGRDGQKVWSTEISDLTAELTVPADITKDMHEGRHFYFFDIMLPVDEQLTVLQEVTPVWVYPTAGGVQYGGR